MNFSSNISGKELTNEKVSCEELSIVEKCVCTKYLSGGTTSSGGSAPVPIEEPSCVMQTNCRKMEKIKVEL